MTIEEKLKSLILERYGTVSEFCKIIDMANSTFATIMKNGIHSANITNIIKICNALNISTDELAKDRIVPTGSNLTAPGALKMEDLAVYVKTMIESSEEITLDGKPVSNAVRGALIDYIDLLTGFMRRHL